MEPSQWTPRAVVTRLVRRSRLRRRSAAARRDATEHLQTVSRVAGEIAGGDAAGLVVLDVARSLVDVLDLRDCEFQLPPVDDGPAKPCLRRDGRLEVGGVDWDPTAIGLPGDGFYVPVETRGRAEGRYLCVPRGHDRPSAERVTVAVLLADQAASALLLDSVA